jgi:hypothetical protein
LINQHRCYPFLVKLSIPRHLSLAFSSWEGALARRFLTFTCRDVSVSRVEAKR